MKLRLTTDRNDRGFEQREGDEIDVDAKEAARLLNSRQAEIVSESAVEHAALETPKRKRVR